MISRAVDIVVPFDGFPVTCLFQACPSSLETNSAE
jgi:hypothetical protein